MDFFNYATAKNNQYPSSIFVLSMQSHLFVLYYVTGYRGFTSVHVYFISLFYDTNTNTHDICVFSATFEIPTDVYTCFGLRFTAAYIHHTTILPWKFDPTCSLTPAVTQRPPWQTGDRRLPAPNSRMSDASVFVMFRCVCYKYNVVM